MMIVRLPKTGTVILTSDNVYFAENVTKNLLPDVSLAYDPSGILNAYEWIREMQARENAQFFTAHDPDAVEGDEEGAGVPRVVDAHRAPLPRRRRGARRPGVAAVAPSP